MASGADSPRVRPVTHLRTLLLASALLAPAARAQAPVEASSAPVEVPAASALSVAVLPFESNEAAQDVAPGIAALLASRLAESPLLQVRSPRDVAEGARYVLSGRVERFDKRYVLALRLRDTTRGEDVTVPGVDAPDTEALLEELGTLGGQLLTRLSPPDSGTPGRTGMVMGLRVNNSFISRLASLNPGADVELGYAFDPEWVAFVQVGINFVRANNEGAEGKLNVLPSVVGVRHYHRVEHALRPYWGFGLGVQLSFGDFGILQSTGPLPTVTGFLGAEYLIGRRVGLQLEAGTNVAQAVLGLAGNRLGNGINLDLNAGVSYHF
jgi:TolB-like protein